MQFLLHIRALVIRFRNTPVMLLAVMLFISGALVPMPVFAQEDDEEEFVQEGFEEDKTSKPKGDPIQLFNDAQKSHQRGEFDKALELYSKAIEAMPEFPEAEYQRASIYLRKGNLTEAEKGYRKAVSYRTDWTLALSALGQVLVTTGKYAEAEQLFDKAIKIDPRSFLAYVGLTDLYLLQNPGTKKITKLYSRVAFFASGSRVTADVWSSKAALELRLGKLKDAQRSIEKSLEVKPANRRARFIKVEHALKRSDFDSAISESLSLLKESPQSERAVIGLARTYVAAGQKDKAVVALKSFAGSSPEVDRLALELTESKDIDIEALKKTLAETPKDIGALSALCSALRRGDPKSALEYCRQAYLLEPETISHAIGFGAALVQLRQFDSAVRLLTDIKNKQPKNHTVRANLASAYFQMKDFEKAKVEYLWITQNSPEVPVAFYLLAICYDRLNEYPDALANYQQFLKVAEANRFKDEIDRVTLRLPILQRQIKKGLGKKKK